jgi:propionyl-CoA carboxylase alpha chain
VYAEDPANNFLPDIGRLSRYRPPQGPGIRVDDGFQEGMDIPIYYDPMIAKLVVHGASRQEAIQRMIRAISEYSITGVTTTLPFCNFVLKHPAFVSGKFDTHFVKTYFTPEVLNEVHADEQLVAAIAAVAAVEAGKAKVPAAAGSKAESQSKWKSRRFAD